jgi:hypothetical protein
MTPPLDPTLARDFRRLYWALMILCFVYLVAGCALVGCSKQEPTSEPMIVSDSTPQPCPAKAYVEKIGNDCFETINNDQIAPECCED